MKKQSWILIVVVILIVGGYITQQSTAKFTVYPVFCKDWTATPPATPDFSHCHQPYAYEREVFVVDKSKNQVTETSPDNSNFYTLNSCTVQDNEHWGCGQSNDAFGAVSLSRSGDGFSENGLYGTPINTIFVTESEWNSINNGAVSPEE